ncbi:MAG: winged helix-turn-helix transcriptional regulator [Candidatus Diapherotrites archaeon]|nr:winged helix-turn-helix transcriptional regulator [Candidatus Diapherotrites archaeon]
MNDDLRQRQNLLMQASLFKLLGDTNRLRIIRIISYEPSSVSNICCELKLEQSLVSHHLSNLRKFNVVSSQRNNKQIIYSIKRDMLSEALDLLDHFLERIETETTLEKLRWKELESKHRKEKEIEAEIYRKGPEAKKQEEKYEDTDEFSNNQYEFKKDILELIR